MKICLLLMALLPLNDAADSGKLVVLFKFCSYFGFLSNRYRDVAGKICDIIVVERDLFFVFRGEVTMATTNEET